jgi:lipopolysaccharide transport system permease protein
MSLQTLTRYKNIVFYRTLAGIKSEARKNYLGYVWFLLEPLMSTAVLYVAFGQITGRRGPDYIMFLLTGMMAWQWFEGSVMVGAQAIRGKFHVLNYFALPKSLFPLVSVMVSTWKFACVFVVLLLLACLLGYPPNPAYGWLPLLLGIQLALICGVACGLAVVVTLVNDMQTIISSVFRLLFFLSGIFFSADRVPDSLRGWFYLNPMAGLIEGYRAVLLHAARPAPGPLLTSAGFAGVALLGGLYLSARYDKKLLKLTNV